jgi:rhomboid family GlyGly-CTERM serine protease
LGSEAFVKTTLTIAAAALAAALLPGPWLELTRGGEPWRWLTGHLTHWSHEQLLWDLLAFVALGIACERRNRAAFHATLAVSALLIPLAVWVFAPEVVAYRGLSGIDSALFVLLLTPDRSPITYALGAAFMAKIGFEMVTASTVFVSNLGGAVPVPVAHVAGAGAALLVFVCHPERRARDLGGWGSGPVALASRPTHPGPSLDARDDKGKIAPCASSWPC